MVSLADSRFLLPRFRSRVGMTGALGVRKPPSRSPDRIGDPRGPTRLCRLRSSAFSCHGPVSVPDAGGQVSDLDLPARVETTEVWLTT